MKQQQIKVMTIRLPIELWKYVHKTSIDREMSVNGLITECLENYQRNREKKLEKKLDD